MDKLKIILENGFEKEVSCLFFLYNLKYYLIYTESELDENGYVIFYLVEVGKEIKNTPEGQIQTGYMVGVAVNDSELMQSIITRIVDDKKNGTQNSEIKYLPLSMISILKIVSNNKFRLMKNVAETNFNINLSVDNKIESSISNNNYNEVSQKDLVTNNLQTINESRYVLPQDQIYSDENPVIQQNVLAPINPDVDEHVNVEVNGDNLQKNDIELSTLQNDVIIDYRTRFFEEQEKNKSLVLKIEELTNMIEDIKKIIE